MQDGSAPSLASRRATPRSLIERERHVLAEIAAGRPLAQVLEGLLRSVEEQAGHALRASVLLLSEDGLHLHHGAAPSLPPAYNAAIDGIRIGEGVGSCGTVVSRGTPVHVSDIAVDPLWTEFRDLALAHGLRACWSTPIEATAGGLLGTFAIYYDEPRTPTQADLDAMAEITQTASLAIERHRADLLIRRGQDSLQALNAELERQVDARTREYDRVWRNSQDLLVIVDLRGVFRAVNPASLPILGWSPNEMVGFNVRDFVHPDDRPPSGEDGSLDPARYLLPRKILNRYRHKDGSHRWLSWMATFEDERIYAYGRDVTVEKEQENALLRSEEALRQSQKMEAIGQLTGGLAHDFNNLLAGISGSLELMGSRMQQGRLHDIERYLTAAQGAAKRAAALTHRLLAFSRRQTLDPKPTNVNRLAAGMQELIQRTVGPTIPIDVVEASGLWPALVDPSQLENALLNLCINARDAMPGGGRITIETANKWLDARAARQQDMPEGQYLSLCVTDTGSGMPPEVIARVFEPFFTTKPVGEGTGLGLSMIYGFAKQSGGQVRIYSEVGTGTTVCVYLPRHLGEVMEDDAGAQAVVAAATGASDTVLVVDDEPTVRMLLTDILEDLGCTAIEATDSAAGLRILQSDVAIDLLVTDVGLPGGMNGRQMADAARTVRPDLKVLFITGYAENAVLGNGHLAPGMAVLTKPFAMDTMAARIRSMIEAGKEAKRREAASG